MAAPHTQRKPTFFWQGVLILLPVALMAGFGFWAILRERNAVEHEAQQRAKEMFQTLPSEFGRIAANRLTQFDGPKGGWFQYLQWALSPWPENKNRKQWMIDINESQIISNNLVTLRSAFPNWQAGPVPLVDFRLNTNGDLWFGHPTPLRPPTWLAALRSSSDLSRVQVTHKTGKSAKPVVFTVDVSDSAQRNDDLWLQDGDVIEVPEKR
jgi:hypothetical protein